MNKEINDLWEKIEPLTAVKTVILFMLGVVCQYYYKIPLAVIGGIFFIIVLIIYFLRRTLFRQYLWLPPIIFSLLLFESGMLCLDLRKNVFPHNHIVHWTEYKGRIIFKGVLVQDPWEKAGKINCIIKLDSLFVPRFVDGPEERKKIGEEDHELREKVCGNILIKIQAPNTNLEYGDAVLFEGRLKRPTPQRNPGGMNYRLYLETKNIYGLVTLKSDQDICILRKEQGSYVRGFWILPTKRAILKSIDRLMTEPYAGLMKAMLFGGYAQIPEDIYQDFVDAGLLHLIAISGLQVALVIFVFYQFFLALGIPYRKALWIVLVFTWFYLFLTDFTPSVFRATVMADIFLIGKLMERRVNIYQSLAVSAWFLLLWNPLYLFDAGFLLSYLATLSLVATYPCLDNWLNPIWPKERWTRFRNWLLGGLLISIAAGLGTIPVTACFFNRIPGSGLLSNLIGVPLLGILMPASIIMIVFSFFSTLLAEMFGSVCDLIMALIIKTAYLFGHLPAAYLTVPHPSILFIILFYTLLILVILYSQYRIARKLLFFLLLLTLNGFFWKNVVWTSKNLEVYFLDVGQGDGILCRFPNGQSMLIDGGPCTYYNDSGKRAISPALNYLGIRKIDLMVLSHPHNDHIGGLISVLETFPVGCAVDGGQIFSQEELVSKFYQILREKNISYTKVSQGDEIKGPNEVSLKIISPNRELVNQRGESLHGLNNGSVVILLEYKKIRILLTGDMEAMAEKWLSRDSTLGADVLKVAHHGSKTSSTPAFIKQVSPRYAIVSCGIENRYGLPDEEVLETFQKLRISVYRTDLQGAVIMFSDGEKIKVKAMLLNG